MRHTVHTVVTVGACTGGACRTMRDRTEWRLGSARAGDDKRHGIPEIICKYDWSRVEAVNNAYSCVEWRTIRSDCLESSPAQQGEYNLRRS